MGTLTSRHWTDASVEDFTYRIASDFLAQVETKIEAGEVSRTEFAHRLDRTPGRVSQLFNNPGNLTVSSAVRLVRAAGMKVALVAYDDNDPQNNNGPVNSDIFYRCWKHVGAPKTFFELASTTASIANLPHAFSTEGSNQAGVVISTMPTRPSVFNLDPNFTVMTVVGNHDTNWPYHFGLYQGSGSIDAANTGSYTGKKAMATTISMAKEPTTSYA